MHFDVLQRFVSSSGMCDERTIIHMRQRIYTANICGVIFSLASKVKLTVHSRGVKIDAIAH